MSPYIQRVYKRMTVEKILRHIDRIEKGIKRDFVRTVWFKDSIVCHAERQLAKLRGDKERIQRDGFTIDDIVSYYG